MHVKAGQAVRQRPGDRDHRGGPEDRLDLHVWPPITHVGQRNRGAEGRDGLAANARRFAHAVEDANAVARRGAAHLDEVLVAGRAEGNDLVIFDVRAAGALEEVGMTLRRGLPLGRGGCAQVKIAGWQHRLGVTRGDDGHARNVQGQNQGRRPARGRADLRIEAGDGFPVRAAGQLGGQRVRAAAGPLRRRNAGKVDEAAVGVVIGRGHEAALAVSTGEVVVGAEAQVVVGQEEEIVAKLVRQGAPPVLAKLLATVAERIPIRADPNLARGEGIGDDAAALDLVRQRAAHNSANRGRGPHAVVGIHDDVRGQPVFLGLMNLHIPQRGLTIRHFVQQLGSIADGRGQVIQERPIVARIPLQGNVEIEQQQRMVGCGRQGLDARGSDRVGVQAGQHRRGAGVVKRITAGRRNRLQRDEAIAERDRALALEIPLWPGDKRRAAVNAQGLAAVDLLRRQAVNDGAERAGPSFVQHAHLRAAHAERIGLRGDVRGTEGICRTARHRQQAGISLQTKDHVVALPQETTAQHIPGINRGPRRQRRPGRSRGHDVGMRQRIERRVPGAAAVGRVESTQQPQRLTAGIRQPVADGDHVRRPNGGCGVEIGRRESRRTPAGVRRLCRRVGWRRIAVQGDCHRRIARRRSAAQAAVQVELVHAAHVALGDGESIDHRQVEQAIAVGVAPGHAKRIVAGRVAAPWVGAGGIFGFRGPRDGAIEQAALVEVDFVGIGAPAVSGVGGGQVRAAIAIDIAPGHHALPISIGRNPDRGGLQAAAFVGVDLLGAAADAHRQVKVAIAIHVSQGNAVGIGAGDAIIGGRRQTPAAVEVNAERFIAAKVGHDQIQRAVQVQIAQRQAGRGAGRARRPVWRVLQGLRGVNRAPIEVQLGGLVVIANHQVQRAIAVHVAPGHRHR